eukprot:TRINITY_DN18560_c0_g1_i1.p1 TRINITY_DN18560_c0_g1~~TRINITY_DN18560_c0_g1_i1.p1  ORF type:complete len:189 (-),score=25.94 TRINITY_DN18560_c0_g1_i1:168-734(-)
MEKILKNNFTCNYFLLLYKNYSCLRCILRFFKVDHIESYRNQPFFVEILHNVTEKMKLTENLIVDYNMKHYIRKHEDPTHERCRVCLGILQKIDQSENVAKIADRLKKEGFEFNDFKINLQIPLSTSIRYAHVNSYYKDDQGQLSLVSRWSTMRNKNQRSSRKSKMRSRPKMSIKIYLISRRYGSNVY